MVNQDKITCWPVWLWVHRLISLPLNLRRSFNGGMRQKQAALAEMASMF